MLKFARQPQLEDTGRTERGRAVFRLAAPLTLTSCHQAPGLTVTVPAGFETDFATVPRAFWPCFNPAGPWRAAAIVHDYLYTRQARCDRFLADVIFRAAMHALRVPAPRRLAMYYAVRAFGWLGFRSRSR
jgi:hypothetical protein